MGFLRRVEGAEPMNDFVDGQPSAIPIAVWFDTLGQVSVSPGRGIATVLGDRREPKIVQTVVSPLAIDVIDLHLARITVVNQKPDKPVGSVELAVDVDGAIAVRFESSGFLAVQVPEFARRLAPPKSPGVGLVGKQLFQPGSAR